MKEITLTKKEAKLLLGIMDTTKYDIYFELWEYVDDNEIERLEEKLKKVV